jgi:hypothetical protein
VITLSLNVREPIKHGQPHPPNREHRVGDGVLVFSYRFRGGAFSPFPGAIAYCFSFRILLTMITGICGFANGNYKITSTNYLLLFNLSVG